MGQGAPQSPLPGPEAPALRLLEAAAVATSAIPARHSSRVQAPAAPPLWLRGGSGGGTTLAGEAAKLSLQSDNLRNFWEPCPSGIQGTGGE